MARSNAHNVPAGSAGQPGGWIVLAVARGRRVRVRVSGTGELELAFLRDGGETPTSSFAHCAGASPVALGVPEDYRLAARRPAGIAGDTVVTVDEEG